MLARYFSLGIGLNFSDFVIQTNNFSHKNYGEFELKIRSLLIKFLIDNKLLV